MIKIIKKINGFLFRAFFKQARLSFAQNGEDMILSTILCHIDKGFYVDIGANNPYIQSNTFFFYKKGWSGINIDALPNSMDVFKKKRKRDINLEIAISDQEECLDYYMFNSSFFNSFSESSIEQHKGTATFIGKKRIKTHTLSDILDKHQVKTIDFMSVDVEGFDLQVIKSNNWHKYRPKLIIIEHHATELLNHHNDIIDNFLKSKNYFPFCNTSTNVIYIEKSFLLERYRDKLGKIVLSDQL